MGTYGEWKYWEECNEKFFATIMLPLPSNICPNCYGKHMKENREETEKKYGYNPHYHK